MPSCVELVGSYNNFLVWFTAHFQPLDDGEVSEPMEVLDRFLVDIGNVSSALRLIKTTKSPGPDNFCNKLLKIFAFELAPVITDIYNATMLQGNFPQQVKRALVAPIFLRYPLQNLSRKICVLYRLRSTRLAK